MTTPRALTAEFEDWMQSARDCASPSEWQQVVNNIKSLVLDEEQEISKDQDTRP